MPWMHETCGHCAECCGGAEFYCQEQRANGYDVDGGFAEYALLEAAFAVRLLVTDDAAETAPLLCAALTAYGSLKTSSIRAGERCAIIGCGGLGLYAVQLAVRMGVEVTAVDVSAAKLQQAKAVGAAHLVTADADAAASLRATGGMHAVINFAPTSATWPLMIAAVRARGTIVAAAMVDEPVPLNQEWLTMTGVRITGTSVGTREEMAELLAIHRKEPLRMQIETLPLEEINEGLERLRRGGVNGRLVIRLK